MKRGPGPKRTQMRKTYRKTGPDRKTRALMYDRDGDRCYSCGDTGERDRWIVPNHRVNRGHGGSTAPWVNDLTNLHTACRSCNNEYEHSPAVAYASGWKVRHGFNPASVPICDHAGRWWLLTLEGLRIPISAPQEAA